LDDFVTLSREDIAGRLRPTARPTRELVPAMAQAFRPPANFGLQE